MIQRLFGVQLAFSTDAELPREARERIAAELQAALSELRRALQRPLGRTAPESHTTLLQEIRRLQREHRDLGIVLARGSDRVPVPRGLEALAQSVLAEAVRNARKHARPTRVDVRLDQSRGGLGDGDRQRRRAGPRAAARGWGCGSRRSRRCRPAGSWSSAPASPDVWRVRLAVPLDRA